MINNRFYFEPVFNFQDRQRDLESELKKVDDSISSIKERMDSAEKLVEEGNILLKACVKKMNHGQQKVETGRKNKRKLDEKLQKAIKKRKEMVESK